MSCDIDPKEPHLQKWLKEGLSLETHTVDHPCPILRNGNLARAKSTFDRCVDRLATVPNSRPVAFRTPCCDSLNTVSPRLYAEIFNKTTPQGNFLTLDSSVFNVTTTNDPALPRNLVLEADGSARFQKYLPRDRTFVNTIEDYPYPYILGRLCWEFPCATPSDWLAQHYHGPNNPKTVSDWKALLDATVIKQGVFNMVFHPHGWIRNEQVVDFIDYAAKKYGKRVKFLAFRACQERLNKNLLGGQPLRDPKTGQDNGVRLLDVNNDGFMDVVIGNAKVQQTASGSRSRDRGASFPFPPGSRALSAGSTMARKRRSMRTPTSTSASFARMARHRSSFRPAAPRDWHFEGDRLGPRPQSGEKVETIGKGLPVSTSRLLDSGDRLRNLDGDGRCELLVANNRENLAFAWSPERKAWRRLPLPCHPQFGSSIPAAATPGCTSQTSTKMAMPTSSSPMRRNTASTSSPTWKRAGVARSWRARSATGPPCR